MGGVEKRSRVNVEKLTDNLIANDEEENDLQQLFRNTRITDASVEMVNKLALIGHYGPGFFGCDYPNCLVKETVTRASVVHMGDGNNIYFRKRYYCNTPNLVYALQCRKCLSEGTIHVGRTQDIHQRLTMHHNKPNHTSINFTEDNVKAAIATNCDPYNLRQDMHVHVKYEHGRHNLSDDEKLKTWRSCFRVVAFDVFGDNDGPRKEDNAKIRLCSYDEHYLGNAKGGLNKIGNC